MQYFIKEFDGKLQLCSRENKDAIANMIGVIPEEFTWAVDGMKLSENAGIAIANAIKAQG